MKKVILWVLGFATCILSVAAIAAGSQSTGGIGGIAENVTGNLGAIAKLITAASYVAGMAFVVGAIVKFKAHKDNPTQIPIGTPIALLFVGAALLFAPTVFKSSGATLFGGSGKTGGISGVTSFGAGGA